MFFSGVYAPAAEKRDINNILEPDAIILYTEI
jgi:hypothetical protein